MTLGLVEYVFTKPAETTLTSAALVGATTLDVVDGTVFAGAPSALLPDGSVVTVTDYTATTLTVSAIPVALAETYDVVRVEPAREVKWAGVNIAPDDEFAEAINCRVPHNSQAYLTLADGIYSGTDRTLVEISTFPEPIVVDVKNQQAVHDASTVPIVVRTEFGESVRIDGDGITTYTNDPVPVRTVVGSFGSLAADAGYVFAADTSNDIHKYDIATGAEIVSGFPIVGSFDSLDADGGFVYALDTSSSDIRKFNASTGVEVVSGFPIVGTFTSVAADGGYVYARDGSDDIRKFNASTGVEVVSGFPIVGTFTSVAADGGYVYARVTTVEIRKYDATTGVQVVSGFPIAGSFYDHAAADGYVYATDTTDFDVHKYDATTGVEVVSGFPIVGAFFHVAADDWLVFARNGNNGIRIFNSAEDYSSIRADSSAGTINLHAVTASDITSTGEASFEGTLEVRGLPYPFPYCELRASAATTGIVTATVTKVNLATEVHNDTDFFSVSASVITVTEAGAYDIQGSGTWSLSGTPTLQWGITKNGTATFITANGVAPATFFQSSLAALGVTLAAGDTVRLCAFQTTGSNQSTFHDANNQARLIIRRVA